MIYTINNQKLQVSINSRGGELWSIKDTDHTEYLWQGDDTYWGDRAINLFPYIARLTDGTYTYAGKKYQLDIHGFLKDTELTVWKQESDSIIFMMESSASTLQSYPFVYTLKIQYQLVENTLEITYIVENQDNKTMYFGVGGHPGFFVPIEDGLSFNDYYLEFLQEKEAMRVGMSDDCFVTDQDTKIDLVNGTRLPLAHSLFDHDAIILKNMSKQVTIKSDKAQKQVCVEYENMDYLGIWHMPRTDAPYICIEPWTSLPSRKGVVEALEEQKNLISLESHKTYKNLWKITI